MFPARHADFLMAVKNILIIKGVVDMGQRKINFNFGCISKTDDSSQKQDMFETFYCKGRAVLAFEINRAFCVILVRR